MVHTPLDTDILSNGGNSVPPIETTGLGKTYPNGVTGLTDLTMAVEAGEICGLLGPNGAGKTTTVRLLNGTLSATEGHSRILGIEGDSEYVRKRTATLAELAQLYEQLSVADNLRFFGALYDIPRAHLEERIDSLLGRMGLAEKKELKLGSFSTGMRKRVQLARTLLNEPEILFLDEPTAGLDPEASAEVISLIDSLARAEGTTVLLCTHNLSLAERICDSFGFLDSGRLVAFGKKKELFDSVRSEQLVRIVSQLGEEDHPFDHYSDINGIISTVMERGGEIRDVTVLEPSLEDVYFHFVGKNGARGSTGARREAVPGVASPRSAAADQAGGEQA
jgi:ABC-2 type transport system ATP-binding protein